MERHQILKLSKVQQIVDINNNQVNFKLRFIVSAKDKSIPFQVLVTTQSQLDDPDYEVKFRTVSDGNISGNILADKNKLENYLLILKSDNECEVRVDLFLQPLDKDGKEFPKIENKNNENKPSQPNVESPPPSSPQPQDDDDEESILSEDFENFDDEEKTLFQKIFTIKNFIILLVVIGLGLLLYKIFKSDNKDEDENNEKQKMIEDYRQNNIPSNYNRKKLPPKQTLRNKDTRYRQRFEHKKPSSIRSESVSSGEDLRENRRLTNTRQRRYNPPARNTRETSRKSPPPPPPKVVQSLPTSPPKIETQVVNKTPSVKNISPENAVAVNSPIQSVKSPSVVQSPARSESTASKRSHRSVRSESVSSGSSASVSQSSHNSSHHSKTSEKQLSTRQKISRLQDFLNKN